ncbi:DUF262 domain-containing protein [Myroides marinus]|uniref:DUF262 domain-containing protein n=1 Tax=Myroides marinus TaxID=703342 RepID=UPI002577030D|nr:DUF262 domain-containing protein [Myroides marinus]MDM1533687.1 DUF262 domain-containing protein [Myroides marinus]MDM1540651.1 DUF262 domain-containing protein [Myroides marinus]
MNIIELKPVGKVILNENTPERATRVEHYLIPYYQRGYRWDEENVSALLDDIYAFMLSDEKKYCLQPIVVVPKVDDVGHRIWEVIDGQQRLTTLFIIFKHLNKPKYEIIFEKREKSNDFLASLNEDNYNHDNPDFHFMSKAYKVVKEWFDVKTRNDIGFIDDFNSTLTKRVEIIWYQIEELNNLTNEDEIEKNKIDIFNRLNIGKIPLTDAELIRALLLSKIKYGLSEREGILRQTEMSAEWHRMEQELRNKQFWMFFNNTPLEETASTVEFIFKLIAINSTKKYSTYLWFEKEIKSDDPLLEKENAEKLWIITKEYFSKLKYWFNDSSLYHHLGFKFLFENNALKSVKSCIDNSGGNKSAFRKWAKDEVIEKMKGIDLDTINYEKNKSQLKQVFVLHNILSVINNNSHSRFSFDQYKEEENNGGWSIEHIHAQQSKEMKEEKAIKRWLLDTYESVRYIKDTDFEENEIDSEVSLSVEKLIIQLYEMSQLEKIDFVAFNELKNKVTEKFDSKSTHVLDNLALLSTKQNSSLNNAIFALKRRKIIQFDKDHLFIPPATKNVFLKYYSTNDLQPFYWSKEDKANYLADIKGKLNPYLTIKAV